MFSTAPNAETLTYPWSHFGEADTSKSITPMVRVEKVEASQHISKDAPPGKTRHAICTVRDPGEPFLTRHARVIANVERARTMNGHRAEDCNR